MSLDEQVAELHQRKISARTNAVIARNVALDGLRSLERVIGDLRRKLDHDELEDLDQGGTIPYMGIFGTTAFDIERNLVRITHFLSDMKVAQYDLDQLTQAAALRVVGRPVTEEEKVRLRAIGKEPYIAHLFVPSPTDRIHCHFSFEDGEKEDVTCNQVVWLHTSVEPDWKICLLPKEAHSVNPSPVDGEDSPHGHGFFGKTGGDWQECQYVVRRDPRPDPRSHRFQSGNGSKCTYSNYNVECQGTRRDHELL